MFHYSVILLLSVVLFLYGFFPNSNNPSKFSNDLPAHIGNVSVNIEEVYRPHFQKVVLIIIDAFRWDFAKPELMPLSIELMNQKGCISKISVESPTVTLPRIKALTTGNVPQYIDVVRNLASSEILIDSWLHSARKKGLRTVFYGDNTWEKLFPNFFIRWEGTTSFFVWDFTEVDDNVTRNVNLELERKDWDIMILHYLGLDHIGHVFGPFSSKMPPKLTEMDDIIHKIYQKTNYTDTLILVTGDHGMRDRGGHGGTTHPEVTVPLITIGHNCQNSSFLQTDIPVNLAILLGLNIPSTSIGKIQKDFLNNLDITEYLYALRYNTDILLKKKNLCRNNFDNATYFHEKYLKNKNISYAEIALHLYQECSEKITKELYEDSSKQDMASLFLAVLVLSNVLVLLILNMITVQTQFMNNLELFFLFSIVLLQLSIGFEGTFNVILIILSVLFIRKIKMLLKTQQILAAYSSTHIFLAFTCILHPITFISTSFIEEEHYFWIFVSVTLIVLVFIEVMNKREVVLNLDSIKLFTVLILIRFSMDLNSTVENSVQNDDNWAHILITEENHIYHQNFFLLGLLLVFFSISTDLRISRSSYILHISSFLTLCLIFMLKSTPHHDTFLGKLIWGTILFQKICFKTFSWKNAWLLSTTLLIKPHNVVLIPLAIYVGNQVCNLNKFQNIFPLTVVNYLLSNCFYFLQGHRNSLASVDISIGYTGLNDYYPFLVISQVLVHTYTFPVLFHLTVLNYIPENTKQNLFWGTLLTLRTSVILFTSIVMIIFRHHLFIWSVFAPKLVIESVHTAFLFIELSFWYFFIYVKRLYAKVLSVLDT